MRILERVKNFLRGLTKQTKAPGTVSDSKEVEMERERKRGVRGM